jgi:hypothetical protein
MYGYPVLLKQQASADQQIMEKNMIVLQNDIKSLCYKSVPYKETDTEGWRGIAGRLQFRNPQHSRFLLLPGETPSTLIPLREPLVSSASSQRAPGW